MSLHHPNVFGPRPVPDVAATVGCQAVSYGPERFACKNLAPHTEHRGCKFDSRDVPDGHHDDDSEDPR